jgi:Phosphotransferase enzyme family
MPGEMRAPDSQTADGEQAAAGLWGGICKAWRRVRPDCVEPQNIEVLQSIPKNAIYRLTGVLTNDHAVIGKRCHRTIAVAERLIYDTLRRFSLPALTCHGLVPEPGGEFCWLFLEDAAGHPYAVTRADHRTVAGRWLAAVHGLCRRCDLEAELPDRGPGHYLTLVRDVRTTMLARVPNRVLSSEERRLLRTVAADCDVIESRWDELERFCDGMPRTLVHGDFAPRNIRVQTGADGPLLQVFDWDMAGWGFPASDLAQVDLSARPDLDTYHAVVEQAFPGLDVHDVRQLTAYGDMLRVIDTIYWETLAMTTDAYQVLYQRLLTIEQYEPQLAAALRAIGWSSPR